VRRTAMPIGLLLATALAGRAAGTEYHVAPDGDDAGPGTVGAPWRTLAHAATRPAPGDTVWIHAGTYAEPLRPQTSGTAAAPITYAAAPGETVVLDGTGLDLGEFTGLVAVVDRTDLVIQGLRVEHAHSTDTTAGIFVHRAARVVVRGNRTEDTESSGIGVWQSTDVVVEGNEVVLACNDGSQECITIAQTDGFLVRGNHVHDSGPGSNGGEGIDAKDGATNGRIVGNHVHHIHRLGIYVDAWDKPTHDIEVVGNVVHDCRANGFAIAAEAGGLLERVRVVNNVAYDNRNVGLTVAEWGEPVPAHPIRDVWIVHNTFAHNGETWGGGVIVENAAAENVVIRNNVFSQNRSFQVAVAGAPPGLVVDHNLIDGFRGDDDEVRGDGVVEDDPRFVDRDGRDFHLQAGSPAIDTATADDAPADDFDGRPRPAGAAYDRGAFEFGAGAADADGDGDADGGADAADADGDDGTGTDAVEESGGQTDALGDGAAPPGPASSAGCGCAAAGTGPGWTGWLALVVIGLSRRGGRRRRGAARSAGW